MIVIGVAGLVIVLALYLFYEYLSGSAQVAGIAILLYMAKPTFFADTLYHYEDLAMPLMAFVLFAIVRRSYEPKGRRKGLTLAIWLGLAAVVVTHHVNVVCARRVPASLDGYIPHSQDKRIFSSKIEVSELRQARVVQPYSP